MRKIVIVACCFLLAGCFTVSENIAPSDESVEESAGGMQRRFISLRQVYKGMTRQEVKGVLLPKVIVGYELKDEESKQYKPITISNPYRSKSIQKGSKHYDVDYYLFGIMKSDGQVSDEELVPLVFHGDRLIGYGWAFFNQKIN